MPMFKDPIAPPKKVGKIDPPCGIKNPKFDKRTGPTLSCGDNYGVGFRTPTGRFTPRSMAIGPIVQTSKAVNPSEVLE